LLHADRGHLAEDELIELLVCECSTEQEAAAKGSLEHLGACSECSSRYHQISAILNELRESARSGADVVFTSERLERQRSRILHRVEALSAAPVVIPFPVPPSHEVRPATRSHAMTRWIAAAAAAGLLLGIGVGRHMQTPTSPGGSMVTVSRPAPGGPASETRDYAVATFDDEEFLRELDEALFGQRVEELAALDAFTPRVREVAVELR
jgi:hypothetical protein